VRRPFPLYASSGAESKCAVAHIDKFGNAITSLPNNEIDFTTCPQYSVSSGRYRFGCVCVRSYADLFKGQCGMLQGSSGLIELAMPMAPLSDKYGMHIEDELKITPAAITI
jgi:S-adenosylmethionine hydrolase